MKKISEDLTTPTNIKIRSENSLRTSKKKLKNQKVKQKDSKSSNIGLSCKLEKLSLFQHSKTILSLFSVLIRTNLSQ